MQECDTDNEIADDDDNDDDADSSENAALVPSAVAKPAHHGAGVGAHEEEEVNVDWPWWYAVVPFAIVLLAIVVGLWTQTLNFSY